jgi:hypothetical protein
MSEPRRFPSPWSVDDPDMKLGQNCFIVRDANGQALAYVYFEEEQGRHSSASCRPRSRRAYHVGFDDRGLVNKTPLDPLI